MPAILMKPTSLVRKVAGSFNTKEYLDERGKAKPPTLQVTNLD